MYVIVVVVVVAVLFAACLVFLLGRLFRAVQESRRHRAVHARLAPVIARAEEEHGRRTAAAEASRAAAEVSAALTTVLPAILGEERKPRRVE